MKRTLKLGFIVVMLLIVACSASVGRDNAQELRIGFSGLSLEFLKNTPPQKMFEGDTFPVIIKVKNNGAYSIKDNQAILSLGVEKDYTRKVTLLKDGRVDQVPGTDNAASFSLEGRSQINLIGDEEVISYNVEAGKIDPQSEYHTSTVTAALCYPYETVLDSSICIDTDVNDLRPGKKACKLQDLVINNGQGAPVAVTKVEMSMLPQIDDKIIPQFLIYVEDKGQGLVIKNEAVSDFCVKSDTSHENLNIVYVDVCLSSICSSTEKEMECQLEKKPGSNEFGHIKLKDKKDIIRCALKSGVDSNQDSYISPLKITLMYGYTQSISANYIIQKPVR